MLLLTAFIGLSHSLQVSKLASPLKKFMNRCSSSSRAQYNRNSLMCIDSKGACCKVTWTSARFLSLKEDNKSSNERKVGLLVLLTVPLAWGTFEPAVRYVYAIKPTMPGLVFSAGYYLVAAVSLLLLTLVDTNHPKGADSVEMSVQCEGRTLPIRGGLELGSYLFFGNALQVIGLQTVPSDRAAFLLQLTTVSIHCKTSKTSKICKHLPNLNRFLYPWYKLQFVLTFPLFLSKLGLLASSRYSELQSSVWTGRRFHKASCPCLYRLFKIFHKAIG